MGNSNQLKQHSTSHSDQKSPLKMEEEFILQYINERGSIDSSESLFYTKDQIMEEKKFKSDAKQKVNCLKFKIQILIFLHIGDIDFIVDRFWVGCG